MGALELPVARWGNGLAVRISAPVARELGVAEGSVIQAEVVGPAQLRLATAARFDREAFLERLDRLHERMPATDPVAQAMRRDARY